MADVAYSNWCSDVKQCSASTQNNLSFTWGEGGNLDFSLRFKITLLRILEHHLRQPTGHLYLTNVNVIVDHYPTLSLDNRLMFPLTITRTRPSYHNLIIARHYHKTTTWPLSSEHNLTSLSSHLPTTSVEISHNYHRRISIFQPMSSNYGPPTTAARYDLLATIIWL